MNKLKLWDGCKNFEEAESKWDNEALEAEKKAPIKKLKVLPNMVGITPETAKNLKWKSFKWIVSEDRDFKILKGILKHPIRYLRRYLKSLFRPKSYKQEGDFFLYGIDSVDRFKKLLVSQENIFVIGFSYCHKPFECPSGRFTEACEHNLDNPVCRQCFIGKAVHALPENEAIPLFIPTIHYIGGKIFEIIEKNPKKKILFLITACEMTLEMFGDLGNMVDITGIGIRLHGRICNTMEAFKLSEKGIKPGLTVVLDETQKKMMEFIKIRRQGKAK